jgi:hypothetical protein
MAKRKWLERSSYPKWLWSFDYFWRKNWKTSSYHKHEDVGFHWIWFDAQFLYKWKYHWIEYKACANKNKFTFSAFPDLKKEVLRLQHIENSWWKWYVIIMFNESAKFFDLDFVVQNWDKQLEIDKCWTTINKVKDDTGRRVWDITILIV